MAIIATVIVFGILFTASTVLALYVNSLVGGVIVRSNHRKLISTVLMSLSTIGAVGTILYMNVVNSKNVGSDSLTIPDRPIIPYFRGFYDVVNVPFSLAALLNFYLPLVVLLGLMIGLVKWAMPNYYQSTLYASPKKAKAKKQTKNVKELSFFNKDDASSSPFNASKCNFDQSDLSHVTDLCGDFLNTSFGKWHQSF